MSPWRTILRNTRSSLFILGCAIAIALLLAFGSGQFAVGMQRDLAQSRQQVHAQQGLLVARQDDLAYLEAHIGEYRQLAKQGLMSAPDRENWIDQLLAAQKKLGLPETLFYALPPAVPLTQAGADAPPATAEPAEANPDAPLVHDLGIHLRDVHEGELLALLREFQARIHDRFRVQACRLFNPTDDGLNVECTLRFFTLPTPKPAAQ